MFTPTWRLERREYKAGATLIAGTDEAGSGAWAGPVVAGAVIFTPMGSRFSRPPAYIRDSKTLSPAQREAAYDWIIKHATHWAVGAASLEEIDQLNIRRAGLLAMRRALESLSTPPSIVLSDGFPLTQDAPWPSRGVIKGDRISYSIAAASILAKVTRDRLLRQLDELYPMYGFADHKGYGTAAHQHALATHGVSPVHRASYAPIRAFLEASSQRARSLLA